MGGGETEETLSPSCEGLSPAPLIRERHAQPLVPGRDCGSWRSTPGACPQARALRPLVVTKQRTERHRGRRWKRSLAILTTNNHPTTEEESEADRTANLRERRTRKPMKQRASPHAVNGRIRANRGTRMLRLRYKWMRVRAYFASPPSRVTAYSYTRIHSHSTDASSLL